MKFKIWFEIFLDLIFLPKISIESSGRYYLLIYSILRLATIPIHYIAEKFYYKMWCKIHKYLLPHLMIRTKCGDFFCRKKSSDVAYATPFYEKEIMEVIQLRDLNKGIFIDIGAHIGRYTIMIGRKLKNKGKVIAIEPEPSNFQALLKNIKLNNLHNVIALNIAVSDKNSGQKLFLHEGGGWHSIVNKSKKYIKVKTRKLDTIIKELKIDIKKIKLIKIDVEGAENLVFKGAKKFLRHSDSDIIFEATNEKQLKKLKKILRKFNYKVIRINKVNFLATKNINSFSF